MTLPAPCIITERIRQDHPFEERSYCSGDSRFPGSAAGCVHPDVLYMRSESSSRICSSTRAWQALSAGVIQTSKHADVYFSLWQIVL